MSENTNIEKRNEENSAASGTQKTIGKAKSQMRSLHFSLLSILIIIVLVWLMLGVVFGIMKAPSNDMSPRVDYGDLLLYFRFDRKFDVNEVVVINKNDTIYLGRVIAVGGDTVDITGAHMNDTVKKIMTHRTCYISGDSSCHAIGKYIEQPCTDRTG